MVVVVVRDIFVIPDKWLRSGLKSQEGFCSYVLRSFGNMSSVPPIKQCALRALSQIRTPPRPDPRSRCGEVPLRPRGTTHKSGIVSRFAASVKRPTCHWPIVRLPMEENQFWLTMANAIIGALPLEQLLPPFTLRYSTRIWGRRGEGYVCRL